MAKIRKHPLTEGVTLRLQISKGRADEDPKGPGRLNCNHLLPLQCSESEQLGVAGTSAARLFSGRASKYKDLPGAKPPVLRSALSGGREGRGCGTAPAGALIACQLSIPTGRQSRANQGFTILCSQGASRAWSNDRVSVHPGSKIRVRAAIPELGSCILASVAEFPKHQLAGFRKFNDFKHLVL